MPNLPRTTRALLVAACLASPLAMAAPETVLVTYLAKPHEEAALAKVLDQHWQTARKLNLMQASPHVVLRRDDNGKTTFVEVFTWRDASIPDSAPETITALWQQMNDLTEKRDGKPNLDFTAMQLLAP